MVSVAVHRNGGVHCLKQRLPVYARQDEAPLVQGLGPLGGGPYAHCGERVAYAREEAAFLGQCPGVGHHGEGVHLETVVVVESEGLVPDDPPVQLEAARLQSLPRPRMAAVQHRHVVFPGHGVYRAEQAREVPLGVDVLLPVGREEDVLPFLQTKSLMDIRRLYLPQVAVQHLSHRRTGNVGTLLRQAALDEVSPRVLRVAQVNVGDDVHYPPVGLLRKARFPASMWKMGMWSLFAPITLRQLFVSPSTSTASGLV